MIPTIWYLIILAYKGGTVKVPQTSYAECITQANWVMKRDGYYDAFCVRGAGQK